MEKNIDRQYLREHPHDIFVFGDNTLRVGYGGAAMLRDMPNTYGFVTKKTPDHTPEAYYKPEEYEKVFYKEMGKLINIIKLNPDKTYLISKVGAGLANKFNIWEEVIQPKIKKLLGNLPNVEFLWDIDDEVSLMFYAYTDQRGKLNVFETTEGALPSKLEILATSGIALKVYPPVHAKTRQDAIHKYEIIILGENKND
jgi:hypothetical protein